MNKRNRVLCLCLSLLLIVSLVACKETDEQNSDQPTASIQPTTAPTPTPPPIPYTDVAVDAPYYDAVVWAYKNGIASDAETFGPADACTRGQVITFLWRAKGSPEPEAAENPFSDVSASDWFYQPALWAYENGVATGTTFNPGNPCTNGEALTFLWRAEGKPAASMYHSAVALAASGAYYARPAAWAEANGLFSGGDFDPAAPCSRAELMAYLHWGTEEWTFAEEDKAAQAEFEQIINDAQLYEVHGSGLVYADYVDVDNDGKVELLTVELREDGFKTIITIYASIDGHAKTSCEQSFETFVGKMSSLSMGKAGDQLYLCFYGYNNYGGGYDSTSHYFKIEDGAFPHADDLFEAEEYNMETDTIKHTYSANGKEVIESEFNAILQEYTDGKRLLGLDFGEVYVEDRGLLPDPSAVMQKIYTAVKNGDFSFFAGSYACGFSNLSNEENLTLNKDGALTGGGVWDSAANKKPISISVGKNGALHCVIVPVGRESVEDGQYEVFRGEEYYICPIGTKVEESVDDVYVGSDLGTDTVRIVYIHWGGSAGPRGAQYYKLS